MDKISQLERGSALFYKASKQPVYVNGQPVIIAEVDPNMDLVFVVGQYRGWYAFMEVNTIQRVTRLT